MRPLSRSALPSLALLLVTAALPAQDPPAPPRPQGQQPHLGPVLRLEPEAVPPEPSPTATPLLDAETAPALSVLVELGLGGGTFRHRTTGSALDGSASAGFVQLGAEAWGRSGIGGGLRFEGIGADEDLFADAGFGDTDTGSGDLFLFLGVRTGNDAFRLPLRFGLFLNGYSIEDAGQQELSYGSAGFRFELEPEVRLLGEGRNRWSLYGRGSLGFGGTSIETEPATFDGDADTVLVGVELGTRVQLGPARFGVGWVYRDQHVSESDTVFGNVFRAVDTDFSGLLFSLAVRF